MSNQHCLLHGTKQKADKGKPKNKLLSLMDGLWEGHASCNLSKHFPKQICGEPGQSHGWLNGSRD